MEIYETKIPYGTNDTMKDIRRKVHSRLLDLHPESQIEDWEIDITLEDVYTTGGHSAGGFADIQAEYKGPQW